MIDPALQELIDRQAIYDVLVRYATALDTRDWPLLASCFTEDATTDYRELGGVNEGRDAIVAVVKAALTPLDATQHLIANVVIQLDGDRATASCYLQAQHTVVGTDGGDNYTNAGVYRDRLIRRADGWRIVHRTLDQIWHDGNPRVFEHHLDRWST